MSDSNSTKSFRIDAEFRDYLPAQTPEQQANLMRKISIEGPLPGSLTVGVIAADIDQVPERILIDGHHTLAICEEQGIPLPTPRELHFEDRNSALLWMIQNQDSRRNWTKEQRDYVLGKEYEVTKKLEGRPSRDESILRQNEGVSKGETAERIAKEKNVSRATVERAAKFATAVDKIGEAKHEVKTAILNGTSTSTKAAVIAAGNAKCARCTRLKIDRHDCPQCKVAAAEAIGRKPKAKPHTKDNACPSCGRLCAHCS